MQIFVNGAKTDVYDVSPSIRVSDLKELIAFRSGVSVDNQVGQDRHNLYCLYLNNTLWVSGGFLPRISSRKMSSKAYFRI